MLRVRVVWSSSRREVKVFEYLVNTGYENGSTV